MSKKYLVLVAVITSVLTGCSLDNPDGHKCIVDEKEQEPSGFIVDNISSYKTVGEMNEFLGNEEHTKKLLRSGVCPSGYDFCTDVKDRKNIYACSKCEKNQLNCNGGCIDVLNNNENCGACNKKCNKGVNCVDGVCDDENGKKCPEHEAVNGDICTCDGEGHWVGDPGYCHCADGYVEINDSCEEIAECGREGFLSHPGLIYNSNKNKCECNALYGWVDTDGDAKICSCNPDKGWKTDVNNVCVCEEYKTNNGTDTCSCDSSLNRVDDGNGSCICDASKKLKEENGICTCGEHMDLDDSGVCACDFRNGWVDGANNTCICDKSKKRIEQGGECKCDEAAHRVGDEMGMCVCDVANNWVENANGSCVCDASKNLIEEKGQCTCGENSHKVVSDAGKCDCDATKHWKDDGNGTCICDAEHRVDDGNGACACDTANHWIEGSDGCVCAEGYYFATNGNCEPLPVVGGTIVLGHWNSKPVTWIVLDEKDGNYLVLSKDILDSKPYYGDSLHENLWIWRKSVTKEWCDDFYKRAFDVTENGRILKVNLGTSQNYYSDNKTAIYTEYNMCVDGDKCENCTETEDFTCDLVNVFILSAFEFYDKLTIINSGAGVSSSWWLRSRYKKEKNSNGNWREYISIAKTNNEVSYSSNSTNVNGIRPAMWVRFE